MNSIMNIFKSARKRKAEFVAEIDALPDERCGMCDGTGKAERYEYAIGIPVMSSTGPTPEDYKAFDDGVKNGTIKAVEVPCPSCSGTGITPTYLRREYWQAREKFWV